MVIYCVFVVIVFVSYNILLLDYRSNQQITMLLSFAWIREIYLTLVLNCNNSRGDFNVFIERATISASSGERSGWIVWNPLA